MKRSASSTLENIIIISSDEEEEKPQKDLSKYPARTERPESRVPLAHSQSQAASQIVDQNSLEPQVHGRKYLR